MSSSVHLPKTQIVKSVMWILLHKWKSENRPWENCRFEFEWLEYDWILVQKMSHMSYESIKDFYWDAWIMVGCITEIKVTEMVMSCTRIIEEFVSQTLGDILNKIHNQTPSLCSNAFVISEKL